eukprot:5205918-Karenia_brevis.AAC.1
MMMTMMMMIDDDDHATAYAVLRALPNMAQWEMGLAASDQAHTVIISMSDDESYPYFKLGR